MAYIRVHSGSGSGWNYIYKAYDANVTTFAEGYGYPNTSPISFQVLGSGASFYSKSIKVYTSVTPCYPRTIKIQIYSTCIGYWYTVFEGDAGVGYVTADFDGKYVSDVRVSFSGSAPSDPAWYTLISDVLVDESIDPPDVDTDEETNILSDRATLNGEINYPCGENASERGFEYKKGEGGEVTEIYDTGDFGMGAFSKTPTGLDSYSLYYFRAYADNSEGRGYGPWLSFTTLADPPTVTTQAVSDILSTTATGNGNITATGGQNASKRGVCYNTTGSPTIADDVFEEEGDFGTGAFDVEMIGLDPGETYYVKAYAYNSGGYSYGEEVDFTTDKVAPTVTTQAPTDILPTTATGNGNITALGGENATVRGFKYGLTKVNTWDAHDDGDFGAGAYTKGLTGLSANTTYWIRAYATNTIGTSYGAWVEFQTAASGTIPTGTNLFICADLSGYTYQLMRSETDDGEEYTAYFVISTDLTNKQGLSFYKRILDLHLYFRSEDSGTATIYVKRDNEAEWQEVGSVSLTGTEDIIVKHLAPDIRAKVFLFKITAANFFRFLGCLFEYLPEEMR